MKNTRKSQLKTQRKKAKRIAAQPLAQQRKESEFNRKRRAIRNEYDLSIKAKLLCELEAESRKQ